MTNDRLRNLMQTAWRLAREGARRYGGKAREYIAAALRLAWRALRKATWFAGEGNTWSRRIWIGPVAAWTRWLLSFVLSATGIIGKLTLLSGLRSGTGSKPSTANGSSNGLRKPWRSGSLRWGFPTRLHLVGDGE